jgi:mannose-6-phosphate isomerase
VTVRPGDVLYIPAGTVHALGGSIQCYEVQQSSDVTYRFWDWARVGKDGKMRELHTEKALDVTNAGEILPKCEGATALCKGGSITYYIADTNFELARLSVSGKMPLMSGRMHMITPMGPCKITWPEGEIDVMPMTTVLIPAALEGVTIEGNLKALMSSPSDREYLKNELSYRAGNVAGLID